MIVSKYCDHKNVICLNLACHEGIELMEYVIFYQEGEQVVNAINGTKRGLVYGTMKTYDGYTMGRNDLRVVMSCEDIEAQIEEERVQKELEEQERIEAERKKNLPLQEIPTYECECDECKQYCKQRSCWGTPADIMRLIDAGYANRLMLDWWAGDGSNYNDILLIVPAIKGAEGDLCPYDPRGTCTFFTDDELCEIHKIKPLEGKTSYHNSSNKLYNTHERIAMSWDSEEGQKVVDRWRDITGCQEGPIEGDSLDFLSLLY